MNIISVTGLAAAATATGEFEVKRSKTACVMYTINGTHERYIELSDNGDDWYELVGGGANAATTATAGIGSSGATTFFTGGAAYARFRVVNTSGGAINVTAHGARSAE